MNFSGKSVEVQEQSFINKYLEPGINEIKINSMEIKVASTGSKRVQFNVEGMPINDPKFEGVDGALGVVGRIKSMYLKTESQQLEFIKDMKNIATKIGKEDEFNAIEDESFDAYLDKLVASPVLKGQFFRAIVTGEEYSNGGKIRYNLGFARFKFVESITIPHAETKLEWKPSFHLEKIKNTPISELAGVTKPDGLPF